MSRAKARKAASEAPPFIPRVRPIADRLAKIYGWLRPERLVPWGVVMDEMIGSRIPVDRFYPRAAIVLHQSGVAGRLLFEGFGRRPA